MNTNTNSYTLLYATVMVVIVALLLSLVSGSLKEIQNTNVELDKKKQILSSLNIDSKDQDVNALWKKYITDELVVNTAAEEIQTPAIEAFKIDLKKELSRKPEDRELPLFVASVNGENKYVISLFGAGLWGPIWGYIALNEDKSTIYGTYFSHASETPGLGAEIAYKAFQEKFIGKSILDNQRDFVSIAIVKPGQSVDGKDYIDGISGGTITSQGVEKMLYDCLAQYTAYFKQSTEGGTEE
jgi:Na+-transporting NADH:ubiquinone oxidoreductase subunit C